MPDLPKKIYVRLDLLYMFPDASQEAARYFVSHIETDSVDVVVSDPPFADRLEIPGDFFTVDIQLWHFVVKCEGVIFSVPCARFFVQNISVVGHKPIYIRGSIRIKSYRSLIISIK